MPVVDINTSLRPVRATSNATARVPNRSSTGRRLLIKKNANKGYGPVKVDWTKDVGRGKSAPDMCSAPKSPACLEMVITDATGLQRGMIGWTKSLNSSTNWPHLDWAAYFYNGTIRVYGRANPVTGGSSYLGTAGTYSVGDQVKIGPNSNGQMELYINGALVYTWSNQVVDAPICPAKDDIGGTYSTEAEVTVENPCSEEEAK